MDIEKLKELKEQVEKAYTFIGQLEEWQTDISNHLALLGRFIDEAIARQSETEMVVCPDCGGSGVYQEYDEYDRYYVHDCATCDGSGEIARQSVKDEQAYQPWIRVSEMLPESDDGHQNLVLVLDIGGNYEIEMPSHIIRNIEDYTHWMPLPEPPKGE